MTGTFREELKGFSTKMEDYERNYEAYAAKMAKRKHQIALHNMYRKRVLTQWLFDHARSTSSWSYIDKLDARFPVDHTVTELHDAVDKLVSLGIIENEDTAYKRIRRVELPSSPIFLPMPGIDDAP